MRIKNLFYSKKMIIIYDSLNEYIDNQYLKAHDTRDCRYFSLL